MAAAAILNYKNFNFWSEGCHRVQYLMQCTKFQVPSFIKIGRFITEIWRFNDFQNGGRPPSWILKICTFCYAARIDMLFCFLIQNFTEIGQSVDELWPKKPIFKMAAAAILNFKNFNFWSRDCHWVHYLL